MTRGAQPRHCYASAVRIVFSVSTTIATQNGGYKRVRTAARSIFLVNRQMRLFANNIVEPRGFCLGLKAHLNFIYQAIVGLTIACSL